MDRLQKLLAAPEEDEAALDRLLNDDPHLLHNTISIPAVPTTPLHIALLRGKPRLAARILQKCPELADRRDERGSFPIHLAAAGGHLEIVRQILEMKGPSSSSLRDKDERTPLMLASANGRIDVLTYLLRVDPALSGQVSGRGETALHLCVKGNQVEAAKVLLNWNRELVNVGDKQGNTVLHLATTRRQFQMLELFLTEPQVDVNAANAFDFTARDVLSLGPSECVDMEIDKLLKSYGCKRNLKPKEKILQNSGSSNVLWWKQRLMPSSWFQREKKSEKWFKEKHNTLLIVATLIATVTFAAGLNPPGGVWQDPSPSPSPSPSLHKPGKAIQNDYNDKNFKFFMYFDMCGLVSSLFIILFLVSRLPLKNHLTTWILAITMWVAVTSMTMAFVYGTRLVIVSDRIAEKLFWVLVSWSGLMVFLLFWHLVSVLIHLIHMFVKGIPSWVHLLRSERLSGDRNLPEDPRARDLEMAQPSHV